MTPQIVLSTQYARLAPGLRITIIIVVDGFTDFYANVSETVLAGTACRLTRICQEPGRTSLAADLGGEAGFSLRARLKTHNTLVTPTAYP